MRSSIRTDILKALLAKSGNRCAYPNCNHPIINDNNLLVAQLAHIEAVSPNGPRFNPDLSNEDLCSFKNLLFLCYRHHKEIDSQKEYTVEILRDIKNMHEEKFGESECNYSNKVLMTTKYEIEHYWNEIGFINKYEHVAEEQKIEINEKANVDDLFNDLRNYISDISEMLDWIDTKTKHKFFEVLCLSIPNCLSRISVIIDQLMIKIYEEKILNNPIDFYIIEKLESLRSEFRETAKRAGVAD